MTVPVWAFPDRTEHIWEIVFNWINSLVKQGLSDFS